MRCRVSVLFSEPKIPQPTRVRRASQFRWFQCSSASRKFLNLAALSPPPAPRPGFSALQRAENSSIEVRLPATAVVREFQCSSASRKFLNVLSVEISTAKLRFSALQRAENSSTSVSLAHKFPSVKFQCSSASRKFLNHRERPELNGAYIVSVLFSEPKIPQSAAPRAACAASAVSVLFSEPKIPQHLSPHNTRVQFAFQCSSASRKFLKPERPGCRRRRSEFQCSSASRKFLNVRRRRETRDTRRVSVLFSEPKIPQTSPTPPQSLRSSCFSALQRAENSSTTGAVNSLLSTLGFSALQRAENSSIWRKPRSATVGCCVSVLFSEPKIPQFG